MTSGTRQHLGGHLVSPDGRWHWDGVAEAWKPIPLSPDEAEPRTPTNEPAPVPSASAVAPRRGLSSFVGTVASEDLAFGQTVLVWARWILIGTGLMLSFWNPSDLLTLQVQLAAIIALAFGNFYLHVQLLQGHPAIDRVVYGASLADICVVTTLVIVQSGFLSPVFIFYFAAVVGISVAFPTRLTIGYTALVLAVYGGICLASAPPDGYPAVFTRLLMIAATAVCGHLFARNESHRRSDAIRIHGEAQAEIELDSSELHEAQPASPA